MSASEDAAVLRKAMKGMGTDESAINEVVGNRSNQELVEIVDVFSKEIERDLIKDIKSETGGNYEDLLVGLLTPLASYCADVVFKAVDGMGTDENRLLEIICLRSPAELNEIASIYHTRYGKDMHVHVKSDCGGDFGQALGDLIRHAVLNEGKEVPTPPASQIEDDVEALYKAGEGRMGTDEETFVRILCGNNRFYLRDLADAYAQTHGKRLDLVIKSEIGGYLKQALQYRVRSIGELLAERFKDALDGINNNDRVTRLLVSNKETYLPEANVAFLANYGKTLPKFFEDELSSGDYRRLAVMTTEKFGDVSFAEEREAARLAQKLAMVALEEEGKEAEE
jgi:annexin A7/11